MGLATLFIEDFGKKKEIGNIKYIFYIPYTFCIISEFPFYQNFEKIFRCIRKMFSQEAIYIPIEILLYKIVSLTPSPINTVIIMDFDFMCNQNKLFFPYKRKEIDNVKTTISDKDIPNLKKDKNEIKPINIENDEDDFILITKKLTSPIEKNIKIFNNFKPEFNTKIKFKYLSGYPLIQYNLAKVLFHKLSIEDIIIIFFFTFIESNIIFFSEDIEYLTLTINAFANFNFPLNDGIYFYNIVAISLYHFQNDDMFGIKTSTSIIAINHKFIENYLSKINKIYEHIIVDLDNGRILVKKAQKDHPYFKIMEFISKFCRNKSNYDHIKETKLYKAINNLYEKLYKIEKKTDIFLSHEFINYEDDPNIEKINKSIQEAFYECVIILSLYLYENILLKEENNQKKRNKKTNNLIKLEFNYNFEKDKKYKEEELLILKELLKSMKFGSSFFPFFLCHNPIDLYSIPLSFTDEFLSIFSKIKFVSNIKYFELIDKLYLSKKLKEIKKIDFYSYLTQYISNYKNIFDREIQENEQNKYNSDDSIITKIINYQEKNIIKYQTYELNDNLLLKYIYLINNVSEEFKLDNSFKSKNKIKEINKTEIETIIESFFFERKLFSDEELCLGNIILILSINLKHFPNNSECIKYLCFILEKFNPFRNHILLLLQIIYKLYQQSLEQKNYIIINRMKFCFDICINHIKKQNLVVNKNLMLAINKRIKIEDEIKGKGEDNIINEEFNFKIAKENLQIHYNFTSDRFYNEKYIVKFVNKNPKEYFDIFTGEKKPKILYVDNENEIIESNFISQNDLYKILLEEYYQYYNNLDFNILNKKNILDSCLNILIYMRNNKNFQNLNIAIELIENIFYIFIKNK